MTIPGDLWLQVALVALATAGLFVAAGTLLARALRLHGIQAQLAAIAARLCAVVLLAIGIAVSGAEHRVALIFTVGATYFAAALIDGVVRFRRRSLPDARAMTKGSVPR